MMPQFRNPFQSQYSQSIKYGLTQMKIRAEFYKSKVSAIDKIKMMWFQFDLSVHSELLGQFPESDLGCNTLDFMMTS